MKYHKIWFPLLTLTALTAYSEPPRVPADKDDVTIKMPGAGEMRFRLLPAGRFRMGSPETEKDGDKDEKPVHEVEILPVPPMNKTRMGLSYHCLVMRRL